MAWCPTESSYQKMGGLMLFMPNSDPPSVYCSSNPASSDQHCFIIFCLPMLSLFESWPQFPILTSGTWCGLLLLEAYLVQASWCCVYSYALFFLGCIKWFFEYETEMHRVFFTFFNFKHTFPFINAVRHFQRKNNDCSTLHMKNLPICLGFCSHSPSTNWVCVIFAPEEFALIIHLSSFVSQKYEAIIIHTNLNVFGAWEREACLEGVVYFTLFYSASGVVAAYDYISNSPFSGTKLNIVHMLDSAYFSLLGCTTLSKSLGPFLIYILQGKWEIRAWMYWNVWI